MVSRNVDLSKTIIYGGVCVERFGTRYARGSVHVVPRSHLMFGQSQSEKLRRLSHWEAGGDVKLRLYTVIVWYVLYCRYCNV